MSLHVSAFAQPTGEHSQTHRSFLDSGVEGFFCAAVAFACFLSSDTDEAMYAPNTRLAASTAVNAAYMLFPETRVILGYSKWYRLADRSTDK